MKMFKKCRNKKFSSSEHETNFPWYLLMSACMCDDILHAYGFSAWDWPRLASMQHGPQGLFCTLDQHGE
jgi:hypothetical protein